MFNHTLFVARTSLRWYQTSRSLPSFFRCVMSSPHRFNTTNDQSDVCTTTRYRSTALNRNYTKFAFKALITHIESTAQPKVARCLRMLYKTSYNPLTCLDACGHTSSAKQ